MKGEVVGTRPTGLVHSSLIKKELFSLQCFGCLALVFLGSHLHSLGYIWCGLFKRNSPERPKKKILESTIWLLMEVGRAC